MLSIEEYDDWRIQMQAHLSAMHDEMWIVIIEGPQPIMNVNTIAEQTSDTPWYTEKEWTYADRRKNNLDNFAKTTIYYALDKTMLGKDKHCRTAKQIWEKNEIICEGFRQIKENKLMIVVQNFENFKMKPDENLEKSDSRFTDILNEWRALGKNTFKKRET